MKNSFGMEGNMKTVICYASKTGTTEKAARKLAEYLEDVKIINLEKEDVDLNNFDCIIIGASIRMGQIHKAAKNFIIEHREDLINKKCGFFICNGFPEQAETFLIQNIGQELLSHSICASSFGGELDVNRLKGMDKFIAKAVINSTKDNPRAIPQLLIDNIKQFSEAVNEAQ